MKDLTKALSSSHPGALPFALAQSTTNPRHTHTKLTGLAKVLAGGRVVNMRKEKPFADRMLSDGLSNYRPTDASICLEHVILESVATNLEAGVKLLDKQEFTLAKMGGRLSEMALSLNLARQKLEPVDIAQKSFEQSLEKFRVLTKETFDHTALFSTGPAKPVTVAAPAALTGKASPSIGVIYLLLVSVQWISVRFHRMLKVCFLIPNLFDSFSGVAYHVCSESYAMAPYL